MLVFLVPWLVYVHHFRVNLQALECLNLLINRIFQEKVSNVHAERDRIRAERHKAAIEYEMKAPYRERHQMLDLNLPMIKMQPAT